MDGELPAKSAWERGRHESGSRAGSESQLPVSIAVWEGSPICSPTPSPRQDRRSTAMMECFGISCFEEPEPEEELVAEEAPRKKSSPPKRLKKKRSVKFAAPAEKSSKKLIPSMPPSPRPVCSLPPPTDVVWGPLVDMMPLTPDKELAFFELLHSHPSQKLLEPSSTDGSTIMMFAAEYHAHLAGKMIFVHCQRYGQRYELLTLRNNAGRNAACYVHELDPELPVMKLFEEEMRKNGVDRDSEHARILVPKKKKKSLGVKRAMGLKKDRPDPRAGRPGLVAQQSVRFQNMNVRS